MKRLIGLAALLVILLVACTGHDQDVKYYKSSDGRLCAHIDSYDYHTHTFGGETRKPAKYPVLDVNGTKYYPESGEYCQVRATDK